MKRSIVLLGFAAAVTLHPAAAQRVDSGIGQRIQGGGINYAPMPGTYTVVAVDTYNRMLTLEGAAGTLDQVQVPERVYDLDQLNAGDRITVDFFVKQAAEQPMTAAMIWPRSPRLSLGERTFER